MEMKTFQYPLKSGMDEQTVIHLYHKLLPTNKKEQAINPFNNMDGSQK